MTIQNDFLVEGRFYKTGDIVCRKELHIKKNKFNKKPDLLVIMMNPGGSHPKDVKSYSEITKKHLKKLVITEPDDTQEKIMDFMKDKPYNHACVLNLTNVCNPKSSTLKSKDKRYSNFQSLRKTKRVINRYSINAKAFIVAWGCKAIFSQLINNLKSTLMELEDITIYGYPRTNDSSGLYYYHPLVRGEKWLNKIEEIKWK